MIFISPTERSPFKEIGLSSLISEHYGCDFLISHNEQFVGVQRKKFPADLCASLSDGRLAEQIAKMASLSKKIVILEGHPRFSSEGKLIARRYNMTSAQLTGITLGLMLSHDIHVIWTSCDKETVSVLLSLDRYLSKSNHGSLLAASNPGQNKPIQWYRSAMLQQIPGISTVKADSILEYFGGLPLRVSGDISAVSGIGKGLKNTFESVIGG